MWVVYEAGLASITQTLWGASSLHVQTVFSAEQESVKRNQVAIGRCTLYRSAMCLRKDAVIDIWSILIAEQKLYPMYKLKLENLGVHIHKGNDVCHGIQTVW